MKNTSAFLFSFMLLFLVFSDQRGSFRLAEAKRSVYQITDDLDDVIDDEEDESWKEWGKKTSKPDIFDPPPDFDKMSPLEFQKEILKRNSGPLMGFVKLRLGVKRSIEAAATIAMHWTRILRTGAIAVRFTAVDVNTIMFTMEKGSDIEELKEFILDHEEAYEIKIGEQLYRRHGDHVIDNFLSEKDNEESVDVEKFDRHKNEL